MSVIAGLWSETGVAPSRAPALQAALDFVVADRSALWRDSEILLHARRLAIDPDDRTAPLLEPQIGGVVIAIDGHLFNRPELSTLLSLPANAADEALIASAWERWGTSCLQHLSGEFAFALWDPRTNALLLSVDHLATVPLYHTRTPAGTFAFGTEMAAIFAATGLAAEPDWDQIADRLADANPETTRTYFSAVSCLGPGEALVVTRGRARRLRHWDYFAPPRDPILPADEGVRLFRETLERAVARRMPETGSTAGHITGGLDSSSVAALAARLHPAGAAALRLFSVVPYTPGNGELCGDLRFIVEFLRAFPGCPHQFVLGQPDGIYRLPGLPNGPVNLQLTNAAREIARLAHADGCRVLLTGYGGELGPTCHGQGAYWQSLRSGHWTWLRTDLLAYGPTWRERARWLRRELWQDRLPPQGISIAARAAALRDALTDSFLQQHRVLERCAHRRTQPEIADPLLSGLADIFTGMQQQGRLKDWSHHGRGVGLRYRYPLLDRELLTLVRRLPPTVHRHIGQRRALMRTAIADALPAPLLTRKYGSSSLVSPTALDDYRRAVLPDEIEQLWPALKGIARRNAAEVIATASAAADPFHSRLTTYNLLAVASFLKSLPYHARRPSMP